MLQTSGLQAYIYIYIYFPMLVIHRWISKPAKKMASLRKQKLWKRKNNHFAFCKFQNSKEKIKEKVARGGTGVEGISF